MEKRKTIIFGGAFDPPTLAHEIILKACFAESKETKSDLWIMPSGSRSDKTIPTKRNVRIKYINAMVEDAGINAISVSIDTLELDNTQITNTYDTIQRLNNVYPDRLFIWVFGADSITTMTDWENGYWLFDNLDMLIIKRPEFEIDKYPKKASILEVITPNISSTEVRQRLGVGKSVKDLVGPAVDKLLENTQIKNTPPV